MDGHLPPHPGAVRERRAPAKVVARGRLRPECSERTSAQGFTTLQGRERVMPEVDETSSKRFMEDVPQHAEPYLLKGSSAYDWGMQHRLAQVFSPESGRTVMLA